MMAGAYITIGILAIVVLLVVYASIYPKLKQYRFTIKRVEPKRKRRTTKPVKKKKKSVWVKII